MLTFEKGNLITMADAGKFNVIMHGCNCQGVMGTGIAAQIKKRYPEAYDEDWFYSERTENYDKLGNYTWCWTKTSPHVRVYNLYTQFEYNRGNQTTDHFNYLAFELILEKLDYHLPLYTKIGMPLIGCGRAGGNKERILKLIEEFALDRDVTIVLFDGE